MLHCDLYSRISIITINQVMKFIVSHSDVFYNTLRDQTVETCESLEELSLLTAVLCRAAAYNAGIVMEQVKLGCR